MIDIIRAWKDEEYRMSLSDAERSLIPDNPAGSMELSDDELESIVGGARTGIVACSGICKSVACNSVAFCD
jgi:mersacidin/lichenicidin family type 2 lantibiotic